MNKRILALDLGDKWIGVAHTDLMQIMVIPYGTWRFDSFDTEFSAYILQNRLECVIVGFPKTMQGNASDQTNKVLLWIERIKIKFPTITFHLVDERLSSQFAKKILSENKSKNNSDHTIAAAIILENFLLHYKKSDSN
jgi:putative Holliday junction resolvase